MPLSVFNINLCLYISNGKVVVEGAIGEISSSMKKAIKLLMKIIKYFYREDDLSETTKINEILNEKLVEVGDRVFDYDDQA